MALNRLESIFEVTQRYRVRMPVVRGPSDSHKALDELTQEHVAIRKIEDGIGLLAEDIGEVLQELRILRHLRHENLLRVRSIFLPHILEDFKDIYVVYELVRADLLRVIRRIRLTDEHHQFFLYQILRGMKYVHSAQVLHRNLSTGALWVNSNCDLKICDFGFARVSFSEEEFQESSPFPYRERLRVFYSAPEALWDRFTAASDVWSIACIFAEMLGRKVLFPRSHTQHHVELIINFLGTPRSDDVRRILNDEVCKFIERMFPHVAGKKFEEHFPEASPAALGFLRATLQFDPEKRFSVVQALEHQYLDQLHSPEDEPVHPALDPSDFDFMRSDLNSLRKELLLEAMRYDPEKRERFVQERRNLGQVDSIARCRLFGPSGPGDPSCDLGLVAPLLAELEGRLAGTPTCRVCKSLAEAASGGDAT